MSRKEQPLKHLLLLLFRRWHLSVDSDKDKDGDKKEHDMQDGGLQAVEEEIIASENVGEVESVPNGTKAEEEVTMLC